MQRRGLIVDDERGVCEMIGKALHSAGMEALSVTRSTEAPGLLDEGKFDVVFLDLHMDSPDGIELTRHMRSSRFNCMTPIVLLSDDQRPSAMSVGFAAGASFFLYKPIDIDRLMKLVRATQGDMEHERRRTRRIPMQSKVLLKFGSEEMECETIDVSMCGLLIRAPRIVPLGASLQMTMQLSPHMKPIVTSGTVVRILAGIHIGIQLQPLTLSDSERLQEFLLPMIAGK